MRLSVAVSILFLATATPAVVAAQTPPDAASTYRDFRTRAEAGDAAAQWEVGMMLLNGHGVARNDAEAYRWVRKSGEQGNESGMISTAVMLAMGQGVGRDPGAARDWYRRAAETHGSAHALRGLAGMLLMGDGGAPEPERGLAYLELAAEGGDAPAAQILEAVAPQAAGKLDRAQVDAFKTEWIAAHGRPD
ncbi:MAG TPA: tetratricopeptide repeat protein [Brevundimonas sp.]|jgi:TPR repeat protein|uniref:tetratricopeptide repeat protein n=1 Tax=Brevundimonas sp. TaxID=1871086 RepID=UPI002DEE5432|nr:tetratricopeptide repeat protein [Brevundimonas sp.]